MANLRRNPHGGGRNEAYNMMGNNMEEPGLRAFLQEIRTATAESAGLLHAVMDNHMRRITELYGGLSETVRTHENRLNRHDQEIQQLRATNLELRRQLMEPLNAAQNQGQMSQNAGQDDGMDRPGNRTPPLNRQGNADYVYVPLSPPDSNDGRRTPMRNGDRPTCGYCGNSYAKSYIRKHMRSHCHGRAQV